MAAYKQNRRKKKYGLTVADVVVAVIVILLALYFGWWRAEPQQLTDSNGHIIRGSAQISDGDTIRIGSERIRLVGIDAPELHQNCGRKAGEPYACGETSKQYLKKLIKGRKVECRWIKRDQYNRILADCSVGDEESLNRQMVLDGWAVSYSNYPNEEADARKNKRGIWASDFERPRAWRDNHMQRP